METAPVTAAAPLPNDGEAIELLKKIAAASEAQSSAAKWRRLSAQAVFICAAIVALAAIVLCAVLIPRVTKTLRGIDAATEELNSVAATLNQVDFVGMSESIADLSAIVDPMARLFGRK